MNVLDVLEGQREPLFALLDGGRDVEVLTILYAHEAPTRSLYQGEAEATLGASGPFLCEIGGDPALLRVLTRKGWGKSWGLYLTSTASFDELRHHFRTLLMVRRERDESELYFRFYDPRVLRIFLPTCTARQTAQVFGPVTTFLVEGPGGDSIARFVRGGEQCEVEEIVLGERGAG
jgi:uncharacterized protein DUF4123